MPFLSRIWFSFACFFRVLFDGDYAWRAARVRDPRALPPGPEPGPEAATPPAAVVEQARTTAVLQLLELLQREGRLIDFLQQDIAGFDDAEIGAAARVVHQGCRRALEAQASIAAIRDEQEGSRVEVEETSSVKLTGNVTGSAPYRGTLRHRGWRVSSLHLPQPLAGHDFSVLAPAEIEL